MKIVCPSCDATYEVPEKVVTSRRKMRCARCSQDWVPADVMAAAPVDETPSPPSGLGEAQMSAPGQAAPPRATVIPETAVPASWPKPGEPASWPKPVEPASWPKPVEPASWPKPVEPAASAVGTGYVLVNPAQEQDLPDSDFPGAAHHDDAKRDDEPYQLALRPETHINVFSDRATGTAFGNASAFAVRPPVQRPPVMAWLLSVVVLLAFIGGLAVFRGLVMKAWPPSERLYAALGLVQQP